MRNTAQSFQMVVLCYSLQYLHGHGRVRWTLATKPVVFGNDITLHCTIPKYMKSCLNNAQWTGGKDNNVIAINGYSSNEAKYEMIQNKTSLYLIIKDFQKTDINQRYTCVCGTLVYGKNLTANEIKFLHIPTKSSIVDFSLIESSKLFVNITLKEVYPSPICYILFFSDSRNNAPCDRRNINVTTDPISTEYYQAYLTLKFKIPSCSGNIKVYCSIWQESLVINNHQFDYCPASVNNYYYYIFGFVGVAILLSIVIAGIYYAINNTGLLSSRGSFGIN